MPATTCREKDRRRSGHKSKIVVPRTDECPPTGQWLDVRRNGRRPADDRVAGSRHLPAFWTEEYDSGRLCDRIDFDEELSVWAFFIPEELRFQFRQLHASPSNYIPRSRSHGHRPRSTSSRLHACAARRQDKQSASFEYIPSWSCGRRSGPCNWALRNCTASSTDRRASSRRSRR